MRYELRTTFTMDHWRPADPGDIGRARPVPAQLNRVACRRAQMGCRRCTPATGSASATSSRTSSFEVATEYRTVFGLTADR